MTNNMSTPDKCPHCGEILIDGTSNQWACGSWLHASGYGRQTDLCRERAANAELRKELEHEKWLRCCDLDTVAKLTSELLSVRESLNATEVRVKELEGLVVSNEEQDYDVVISVLIPRTRYLAAQQRLGKSFPKWRSV